MASTDDMEVCKLQQDETEGKQETTIEDESKEEKPKAKRHKPIEDESKEEKPKTKPEDESEVEKPKTKPEDESEVEKPKTKPETTIEDESKPKARWRETIVLDDADRKLLREADTNGIFVCGAIIDDCGLEGPISENYKNYRLIGYGECAGCWSSDSETETDTVGGA